MSDLTNDTQSVPKIAAQAMNNSISASMDVALRGEIKRLREEVADLRREASRAEVLRAEVSMLRSVTLMQAEEKVPLRLRELEAENQRLKRANRSLEEKLASIEGDMKYRELLNSWSTSDQQSVAKELDRSLHAEPVDEAMPSFINGSMLSPHPMNNSVIGNSRILVIKPHVNPCLTCGTRLAAAELAFESDKKRLTSTITSLEVKLGAAYEEIRSVQAWIAPVLSSLQQYPRLSDSQPLQQLHNFASPTRSTLESQFAGRQHLGATMSLQHSGTFDFSNQRRNL